MIILFAKLLDFSSFGRRNDGVRKSVAIHVISIRRNDEEKSSSTDKYNEEKYCKAIEPFDVIDGDCFAKQSLNVIEINLCSDLLAFYF